MAQHLWSAQFVFESIVSCQLICNQQVIGSGPTLAPFRPGCLDGRCKVSPTLRANPERQLEADQGAHPDDPEQVSLYEVERTDIFVLVIGESYGEITEREYDRARDLRGCLRSFTSGRAV